MADYYAARPRRNQIFLVLVLVLVLDQFNSIYEDEDEDEGFARHATNFDRY